MKPVLVMVVFLLFLPCLATAGTPARVISLAPSLTEILYDLGLGDRIVAVTSFCDYPPQAKAKAKIGGMANPSLEAVTALRPDIVVMTEDGNAAAFAQKLHSVRIKTHIFRAKRLDELPGGIRDLGAALGAEASAIERAGKIESIISRMKKRTEKFSFRTAGKVLFVVQPHPLIVAGPGTAIDDSLRLLGLQNIAGDSKSGYPKFSLEEIILRNPDLIMIGRAPGMADDYARDFLKRIETLDAVKGGSVCYLSDPLFRLSPRIIEGIREVEACVAAKMHRNPVAPNRKTHPSENSPRRE